MTDSLTSVAPPKELADPDFLHQVHGLRATDNVTNWFYLLREYVYLLSVLSATVLFYQCHDGWGMSWLWCIPVTLGAVVLIGIGQHRLVMLGHEAGHYLLFKNRPLNEWLANLFCFYPFASMVYTYRLQHLAHHQYTNDPRRDPDWAYMELTGQAYHYPMAWRSFLWNCVLKLLWPPLLIKNLTRRVYLAGKGGVAGPYQCIHRPSLLVNALFALYPVSTVVLLLWRTVTNNLVLLFLPCTSLLPLWFVIVLLTPEKWYLQTAVKPSIPPRWANFGRDIYFTVLFTTLAYLQCWTGEPWAAYYLLLWLLPLATVFSFLMLLREEIQHANAPRQRFLDTRNFKGNQFLKWAVFPLGQSLHLPHHLFPVVPFYNLEKLEKLLKEKDVYQQHAVNVGANRVV